MSKIFVANWKMHKTVVEARAFASRLAQNQWPAEHQAVLCGPFTTLPVLQATLSATPIQWGAQTMHWENQGAHTGEISAAMLVELGCTFVIIGHSERRRDNNETNETVGKKITAALQAGIQPIVCVGESLEQRQHNQTLTLISEQVRTALKNVSRVDLNKIVFAYEPIWAIGTGVTATPAQAQTVHAVIRSLVLSTTPIIYGGSVNPENIRDLMSQPDINGALIGGASLEVESFCKILNF